MDPSRILQRIAATGMGDGLKMAQAVGAAISDVRGFYGHVQSQAALQNEKLWPCFWLDYVIGAGALVGADGKRFTVEGQGGTTVANEMAQRPDPMDAIADDRIWAERSTFQMPPPNSRLEQNRGTVHRASSLEELAGMAGIYPAGLVAQVNAYNNAERAGTLASLVPARSMVKLDAYPIEKAPLYAFPPLPASPTR